jgi:hypothetical protein
MKSGMYILQGDVTGIRSLIREEYIITNITDIIYQIRKVYIIGKSNGHKITNQGRIYCKEM